MPQEIVSPEGLRVDGRRERELRKISCRTGVFSQADGSAYLELGNTKCLAAVYGPREPTRRAMQLHDRAVINVEYNVASFSMGERKQKLRKDRRLMEIASMIKQTFEPVILTKEFPRSEIDIYLQILQVDGGAVHAAINAATLALLDAGIPMTDYVAACSAGYVGDTPILGKGRTIICFKVAQRIYDVIPTDLNYIEESAEVPTLTVALLPKTGKVTMLGLEARLHLDKFAEVINLAADGCTQLHTELDKTIRKAAQSLAKTAI
ncbi:Exosome complex component RRP41 [Borealophlyctis nickersoniae]|nr:Exosome complex component RRP41 [Borealophlyctis nickersoniae]